MPQLSVILTGRNDDHGGGFSDRLFATITRNAQLLRDGGIDFEWIWVEWNPVPEKPLLATELIETLPFVRAYVADQNIHQICCDNPHMVMMEFVAKNAAIRRAHGDWVLTTNADILFSDSLIQRLKQVFNSGSVLSPVIYRAIRNDVAEGVPPAGASDPKNWLFSHHTTPPYHSEGAGDFLLASKSMYCALRGFNETVRIADVHKDTQFCIHAHKLGFSLEVIGDVYHLYHPNSWIHLSLDARMAADALRGKPYNYRADVPYLNSSDWGLESYRERRSDDGLTHFVAESEAVVLEPVPPVDVIGEVEFLYKQAKLQSPEWFRESYVQSQARLLRSRPDPVQPAIAILRRYIQTVWRGLLADQSCREKGVALYGAGRHTNWLLAVVQDTAGPQIRYIIDDFVKPGQQIRDTPIVTPKSVAPNEIGAIVLSSDVHEQRLAARCQQFFPNVPAIRLYDGLPAGLFTHDSDQNW